MPRIPYDAEVTTLWTVVIGAVGLGLIGALVLSRALPLSHGVRAVLVGAAAGVVGALLILGPRMDLVPDDVERLAGVILVVLGSVGLIIATWHRSTRH
jgi:hypothetical protein